MRWVVDASVAVRWLLKDERHLNAELVLAKVVDMPERFAVPELFAFEVFSVIQRLHPNATEAYNKVIIPILQSGLFRQPMTEKLAIAATPFIAMGLTGYDACYSAMAQDLNATWLTFDKKAHVLIQNLNISCLLENQLPLNWDT